MGKASTTEASTSTSTPAVKKRRRKNSPLSNTRVKEYDTSTGMEISNEFDNLSDCIFENDDIDIELPQNNIISTEQTTSNNKPKIMKKSNLQTSPITNEELTKMKPITIDNVSVQTVKNILTTVTLECKHQINKITSNKIQLTCFSYTDKNRMIRVEETLPYRTRYSTTSTTRSQNPSHQSHLPKERREQSNIFNPFRT